MPAPLYGRYLRPGEIDANGDEVVVTLQADPDNRALYEGKGMEFRGYTGAPGIAAAGPRDIDRTDSGIPAGPDGSTHERHPYEVTPDSDVAPPVPWGITMDPPDQTHATRAVVKDAGIHKRDLRTPKEELAALEAAAMPQSRAGRIPGAAGAARAPYAEGDPALVPQDTPNAPVRGTAAGEVTRSEHNARLAARQAAADRTAGEPAKPAAGQKG